MLVENKPVMMVMMEQILRSVLMILVLAVVVDMVIPLVLQEEMV